MAILRKEILPTGKYFVVSGNERVEKEFSPSYLRHIAKTGNKMLKAGLKVPAPFGHRKSATPDTPPDDPSTNAGYWNRFWVSTESGKPGLWGEVDVPGSEDDPNSPIFKVKNTAKETSVCIRDKYIDGKQRKWENALLHVALVNHPVVPGQKDFEDVPDSGSVVNLSTVSASSHSPANISGLIKKLRDVVKIYLPDDCTEDTLVKDLTVAVGQYELSPPGKITGVEPVPVYMSNLPNKENDMPMSNEQIQSIVASGAINPSTGKAFVAEDFTLLKDTVSPEDKKTASVLKAFTNKVIEQAKRSVTDRINQLVTTNRITKDYADQHLIPKVEFQMSLVGTQDNPQIADHPLETTLSALEALPMPQATPQPNQYFLGSQTPVTNPMLDTGTINMSTEDMNKAIDAMLQHLPC